MNEITVHMDATVGATYIEGEYLTNSKMLDIKAYPIFKDNNGENVVVKVPVPVADKMVYRVTTEEAVNRFESLLDICKEQTIRDCIYKTWLDTTTVTVVNDKELFEVYLDNESQRLVVGSRDGEELNNGKCNCYMPNENLSKNVDIKYLN